MPFSRHLRDLRRSFPALGLLLSAVVALAATPITGTVTNKTDGKPSAGDQVTLIQLQQGMQESTHTTTDKRGHFTLQVPDDGVHLVRVTHQKANYFQPVPPGTTTADITVYDVEPQLSGVSTGVQELHVEATPNELHIVEVLQVLNNSAPPKTQFGPGGFDFYLPKGALIGRTGAITQGGMPVQSPAVPRTDPGHFSFLFPIRPGETQFGIGYTLPYTGKFTYAPHLTGPVKAFAVLVPDAMTFTPSGHVAFEQQTSKPGVKTWLAKDVSPDNPPQFTVSGTGTLPDQAPGSDAGGGGSAPNAVTANPGPNSIPQVSNSELAGGRGLNNPLDEGGDRDPWAKYKWWILAGLALLLAAGAGLLLRKPSGARGAEATAPRPKRQWPPEPTAVTAAAAAGIRHSPAMHNPAAHNLAHSASQNEALLLALKEELFSLETERLQQHISEADYANARAAFDLILRRTLLRSGFTPSPNASTPGPVIAPELTGQPRG